MTALAPEIARVAEIVARARARRLMRGSDAPPDDDAMNADDRPDQGAVVTETGRSKSVIDSPTPRPATVRRDRKPTKVA